MPNCRSVSDLGNTSTLAARLTQRWPGCDKHLAWMDSPEGQLQALKYRLADAERELPRAEAEQQTRIREDIAELERQIAQQQKVVDNPEAAEERVQKSIEAGLEGERKPVKPVGGITTGKFINPPPLDRPYLVSGPSL